MMKGVAATWLRSRDCRGPGSYVKHILACCMALAAVVATGDTGVADGLVPMPVKAAAKTPADAWSGFYVGAHFGIAGGSSDWRASGIGAPVAPLSGSIDLFNGFDAFKGTGSFFGGLQGGYNQVLPSGLMLGVE